MSPFQLFTDQALCLGSIFFSNFTMQGIIDNKESSAQSKCFSGAGISTCHSRLSPKLVQLTNDLQSLNSNSILFCILDSMYKSPSNDRTHGLDGETHPFARMVKTSEGGL